MTVIVTCDIWEALEMQEWILWCSGIYEEMEVSDFLMIGFK